MSSGRAGATLVEEALMIIETVGLRKSFRPRRARDNSSVDAVAGLDLTVKEGEIFGFLGPNGAGKTTTLRMLATLLKPDSGEAMVAGADLLRDPAAVRRNIGYVAQTGGTWSDVTAREELVLQGRLHGFGKAEARRRAERALDAFDLTPYADRRCSTYSGGQRRRVEVALGIIHDPVLVFLDEPSAGLDPQSRAHLWAEIRRLRDTGMTVFLTTHYLDEADALCDRVAILDSGGIVAEGSPEELKRAVSGDVLTVGLGHGAERAGAVLGALAGVHRVDPIEGGLRLVVDNGAAAVPELTRALDREGIGLGGIELHRTSLDNVFLEKTGRSLRES